jgi:hypothetical protein
MLSRLAGYPTRQGALQAPLHNAVRRVGSRTAPHAAMVVITAAIAAFLILTIRQGHDWGDDFAMYIAHARNLVNGAPYAATGYIANPHNALGPTAYPPVFPLLLTPVYALFGLNLFAMKVVVIAFFIASLVVLYILLKDELPNAYLVALIALLGFNPVLWTFKDSVLSEFPFMFFTYLALLLRQRGSADRGHWLAWGLAIGLAAYCAYGTRAIGGVLVLVFVAADLIELRRIGSTTLTAVAIFCAMAALQQLWVPAVGSYLSFLDIGPGTVVTNVKSLIKGLVSFWANGHSPITALILCAAGSTVAVGVALTRIKQRLRAFELFAIGYLLVTLIWPFPGWSRFLIPLMPLYVLYLLLGIRAASSRLRLPRPALPIALVPIVVLSYAGQYTALGFHPITTGVATAASQDAFAFIRAETPPDSVLIAEKPRALALFTGRRATAFDETAGDDDLLRYCEQVHATYAVEGPTRTGNWSSFIARHPERFTKVFASKDLAVYRIGSVDERADA